ncbi:MAG: hypothetical protein M3P96_13830, partial [Actinomycetota bacterium]|nr:hypothetical protein [Actinomycetota bacterium]
MLRLVPILLATTTAVAFVPVAPLPATGELRSAPAPAAAPCEEQPPPPEAHAREGRSTVNAPSAAQLAASERSLEAILEERPAARSRD